VSERFLEREKGIRVAGACQVLLALAVVGGAFGVISLAWTGVGERELNAFARAYAAYQAIQEKYEAVAEQARDPEERRRIEREAGREIVQVLQNERLDPRTYNRLFNLVNGDPELRRRSARLILREKAKLEMRMKDLSALGFKGAPAPGIRVSA
jgi:hypothetical protein